MTWMNIAGPLPREAAPCWAVLERRYAESRVLAPAGADRPGMGDNDRSNWRMNPTSTMVEVGPVRVHRPSGPARIPPRFTRSGVLGVGVRAQVGVGGAGLAVAQVGQLDAVTGAMTADGGDQGLGTFDDLVVDLGDHVAVLEAGLVGG